MDVFHLGGQLVHVGRKTVQQDGVEHRIGLALPILPEQIAECSPDIASLGCDDREIDPVCGV